MEELLTQFISKNGIYYHFNIVPGHTPFQVNWKWTILSGFFRQVISKKIEYYYFYFGRDGIRLYQYENLHFFGDIVFIPWKDISCFRYKVKRLEVEIKFVYRQETFCMMLSSMMAGQRWVKENMDYLLENHFFADKNSLY